MCAHKRLDPLIADNQIPSSNLMQQVVIPRGSVISCSTFIPTCCNYEGRPTSPTENGMDADGRIYWWVLPGCSALLLVITRAKTDEKLSLPLPGWFKSPYGFDGPRQSDISFPQISVACQSKRAAIYFHCKTTRVLHNLQTFTTSFH
jgi:hypothetical protein